MSCCHRLNGSKVDLNNVGSGKKRGSFQLKVVASTNNTNGCTRSDARTTVAECSFKRKIPNRLLPFRLRLPMEIRPKRKRLVPSSADEVMWRRELEEPVGETMVQNGLKVTTDEKRQLTTARTTVGNEGVRICSSS